MDGRVNAAAQRQRGGATEPRRTRHPWKGCCLVLFEHPMVLAQNARVIVNSVAPAIGGATNGNSFNLQGDMHEARIRAQSAESDQNNRYQGDGSSIPDAAEGCRRPPKAARRMVPRHAFGLG